MDGRLCSHLEYQVILFGLSTQLASFRCHVDKVLARKLDAFIVAHLNDFFELCQGLRTNPTWRPVVSISMGSGS